MPSSDPNKPISSGYWFMLGGRGPPPTAKGLLRMTSERKAAYREEQAFKAARKKARAEFEQRWGRDGAQGL